MNLASTHSVFRERLFEHQLVFELMRYSWLHDQASLEVSQPAIDRFGHDLVLEARGVTRHVQLKTSWITGRADSQNVHVGLGSKPSGCVLWMLVDEHSMECKGFLFFGAAPGQPLPSISDFKVARHTRKNNSGKGERPNVREIRRTQFRKLVDIADVYRTLFGESTPVTMDCEAIPSSDFLG